MGGELFLIPYDGNAIGSYCEDGMPDITGEITLANRNTHNVVDGAFYFDGTRMGYALSPEGTNNDIVRFSSALVFPRVSNQVVVANIAVGAYISY